LRLLWLNGLKITAHVVISRWLMIKKLNQS